MALTVKFPPLEDGDLGADVALTDDLSAVWGMATGKVNFGMAIYRRLTTPNRTESGQPGLFYDARYGYDVRDLLNDDLDDAKLAAARGGIKAQCMLDERSQSVKVNLAFTAATKALDIDISIETSDGPFELVLRATSLTLDLLTIDGIPAPEPIRPDVVAAEDVDDAPAVVFPPSGAVIGAIRGSLSFGLSLSGTMTQPVADSFLQFSGFADATGFDQTHANYGANANAPASAAVAYLPPACTMRALRLKPLTNTRTVATTFTVYKGGLPTSIQVTIPALSTALVIDSHAVSFNGTTETISLVSTGSPTGTITFGATLETAFYKMLKFAGVHSFGVNGNGINYHSDTPGMGTNSANGYVPPACTVKGLRISVGSNKSMTGAVTFTVYKNGSPTSMTVTVPAGSTSPQVDITAGHAVTFNGTSDKLDLVSSRPGSWPLTDTQFFTPNITGNRFTWNKPADAYQIDHDELGGGGGSAASSYHAGGGGSGGGFYYFSGASGGGGGGGRNKDTIAGAAVAAVPATVTVQAAGGGNRGVTAGSGNLGTDGQDSWFGPYGTATGGRAGTPSDAMDIPGIGGAGGVGNAGIGGSGADTNPTGHDPTSGFKAPKGGIGTGDAAGGGGGGAWGSDSSFGGAGVFGGDGGENGGGGVTYGAGGVPTGAGQDGFNASFGPNASGGGGGGGAASAGGLGGAGGAGGYYGGGAGGAGGASGLGRYGGIGALGAKGFVNVVTTIIPGDLAFGATLELA